ncbi:hypothetical protein D081_2408 [Anaerovibrio sp. JC8]|nr:hypothetical protein D081_2408 [Anaerovibrio sp. JC8]
MAARLLPHGAAAHLGEGCQTVSAGVGAHGEAIYGRTDEIITGRQCRHGCSCTHYGVMGPIRRLHICTCFCGENKIGSVKGCLTFTFQGRAHLVLGTGDGAHAVAKIRHQGHLLVGCQFFYIGKFNIGSIYCCPIKVDVLSCICRMGNKGPAVLPFHISESQLGGVVACHLIVDVAAVHGDLACHRTVYHHTGERAVFIGNVAWLRDMVTSYARCIGQQGHGIAGLGRLIQSREGQL